MSRLNSQETSYSRNLSNTRALIGTHSKSVNNYAKEGNTRQFQLPRDLAVDERTERWKRASASFAVGWGGEREQEWNWLVTNAVRHGWSRSVLAPFPCQSRDAIHGKRKGRLELSPRRVRDLFEQSTSQDLFRAAKAIEIDDCCIMMYQ